MPQIIAYRTVGASCPGILDIFQYANGTMQTINGDWAGTCQSDLEIKDLNGDGIQEILFRKLKYGVNRDIYAWNGERYGLSNKKFAQTYGSELEEIIGYIYSPKSLPAPSRVRLCQQAVQIYRVQQRYSDAIKLCNDALKILDDPALTIPNTVMKGDETPEVKKQIDVSFEWEKLAAKATLYTLFGDVQKAAGHRKQAQLYYQQAQILKEQAEEMHKKSL